MRSNSRRVALFGLLVALALVLGYFDRAIPITWFLSGVVPGIKLGLANTVLLYAIYLMDWKSAVLLMLAKVGLAWGLYGSLYSMIISLAGGVLSLAVMLLVKRDERIGGLLVSACCLYGGYRLLSRGAKLKGDLLWCAILLGLAFIAGIAAFILICRNRQYGVIGTSLAGGVTHNIGQLLAFFLVIPQGQQAAMKRMLFLTYLPFLIGMGGIVGCLTGIVAQRVFKALKALPDR